MLLFALTGCDPSQAATLPRPATPTPPEPPRLEVQVFSHEDCWGFEPPWGCELSLDPDGTLRAVREGSPPAWASSCCCATGWYQVDPAGIEEVRRVLEGGTLVRVPPEPGWVCRGACDGGLLTIDHNRQVSSWQQTDEIDALLCRACQ